MGITLVDDDALSAYERERRRELIRHCAIEGFTGAELRGEVRRRLAWVPDPAENERWAKHYDESVRLAERQKPYPIRSFTISHQTAEITSVLIRRVGEVKAAPRQAATPRAREHRSSSRQRARAPDDPPPRPRRRCENPACRLPLDGRSNKDHCNPACKQAAYRWRQRGGPPRERKSKSQPLDVLSETRLPRRFEVDLLRWRSRPMNGHHEWPGSHLMVEVFLGDEAGSVVRR
jgi:hypothetical protein